MNDAKKIGAFIAQLRNQKGWTQRQLAERLHVTDKAVSKWERGGGYPDISIIPALASALGVTETELFAGGRSDDGNLEAINGAIRSTLLYVEREKQESKRRMQTRVFCGGMLALVLAVSLCRKADMLSNARMTWSGYAMLFAAYLCILLVTACLSKKHALGRTLVACCVGIFPVLYIALRWAGMTPAFFDFVLPVTLFAVFLLGTIVFIVTLDQRKNILSGVLVGGLLVVADVLMGLLLSLIKGEAVTGWIDPDILLLAAFIGVLMILPWPESMKEKRAL